MTFGWVLLPMQHTFGLGGGPLILPSQTKNCGKCANDSKLNGLEEVFQGRMVLPNIPKKRQREVNH